MSTKGLVITLSGLIAAIALVVAMMVVRSVPLGPDGPSISSAQLAKRTAAADRLEGRLRTLANDVPPALPDVPQRLTAAGPGATGAASNGPTGNTPVARTLSNTSQHQQRPVDEAHRGCGPTGDAPARSGQRRAASAAGRSTATDGGGGHGGHRRFVQRADGQCSGGAHPLQHLPAGGEVVIVARWRTGIGRGR